MLRQAGPSKRRRSSSEHKEYHDQSDKTNEDRIIELPGVYQNHFEQMTLINRFPLAFIREQNLIKGDDENGKCLLGLRSGESWCFVGRCSARVLKGAVEVYGALLSTSSAKQDCFSPTTHAPLTFHSRRSTSLDESNLEGAYSGYESVLELSILDKGLGQFDQNPFYGSLFKPTNHFGFHEIIPGVFSLTYNSSEISQLMPPLYCPPTWYQFVDENLHSNSDGLIKIAVLGSKSNGKSTFCKFLVNQLLRNHEIVCFLETDVGQPEFTPSGLLSLNEVTSPLTGPSFTHMELQESRFFGFSTPEKDPALYFSLIIDLYNVYIRKYRARNIPLIINTHGWIKSIGLDLLNQILQLTMPGFIVQFVGANADGHMKNFDIVASNNSELKTKIFKQWRRSDDDFHTSIEDLKRWNYESVLFPPPVSDLNMKLSKWSTADIRNLRFAFYFATSFDHNKDKIWNFSPITCMLPTFIELEKIKTIFGKKHCLTDEERLRVMNASILGLMPEGCSKCHGLAIVRAISTSDIERKGLYLVSPLTFEELNNLDVTIVHKHGDEIPAAMLFKDEPSIKTIPYCETFVIDGLQGHKMRKTRRNLLRKYHS